MSTAGVIGTQSGRSVSALPALVDQGYVQEHSSRQGDGRRTSLFSLTASGESVLKAADEAPPARPAGVVASARTEGPSAAIYQGNELRPFAGRAGSMAAFAYPSRVGAFLHHSDGSITPIE
jgi:DNA-binding MarR family transcriptional regulator